MTGTREFKAGDLLSIVADDGLFGVVKVLVADGVGVHIRLYQQRFEERPLAVEPEMLTLGGFAVVDPGPFSMGHIPVSLASFAGWQPMLISSGGAVEERELAGYRNWEDAEGGYF